MTTVSAADESGAGSGVPPVSDSGTLQSLAVRGISKQFGATRALRGVDLDVRAGEIHALLGGNGSGKSTLIKTLAGVHRADTGEIELCGTAYGVSSYKAKDAVDHGLRFVHQQGMVFPGVTVQENLIGADQYARTPWGQIRWSQVRRTARELLERFDIDARPDDLMGNLRPVTQQMIAIARALQPSRGVPVSVLVLDEPTATLPRAEVGILHEAVRRYANTGCSVIYVTHRLDELPGFVDRATVLRDGQVVGRLNQETMTHGRLVDLIAGESAAAVQDRSEHSSAVRLQDGTPRLRLRGLSGGPVSDINLSVRRGEIVALTGLVGSGRTSVLQMVFGLHAPATGSIEIDGVTQRARVGVPIPGVAYIPEDRLKEASFSSLSVLENLMAAEPGRFWNGVWSRGREERKQAASLLRDFKVKAESASSGYGTLSGGNQQKVVLARWLSCDPKVILLDEPSQGVDVGARAEIHNVIRKAAADGAAVVIASSDLEEVSVLADRALVLADGHVIAEVASEDLTDENLERLSFGLTNRA